MINKYARIQPLSAEIKKPIAASAQIRYNSSKIIPKGSGPKRDQKGRIMLKGIPNILSPELLKVLDEMGHTDELTIGDGNFPGHTYGKRVIRLDGHGVPEILDAILQVMPLDTYPNAEGVMVPPCTLMAVEPGDDAKTPIWDTYKEIVAKHDPRGAECFEEINKWDFYKKTKENSTLVIMTSETAIYANIILRKGVVINK